MHHIDRPLHHRGCGVQGIIARIEKLDLGPQNMRCGFGFGLALGLDLFQRHTGLFPRPLAFAALAE